MLILLEAPIQFIVPNLTGFSNIGTLIQNLLLLAFFVAGIAFLFNLILGGIQWISAGGDPKNLQSARTRITNSAIGLAIVVAAFAITTIAAAVLGINIFGFKFPKAPTP